MTSPRLARKPDDEVCLRRPPIVLSAADREHLQAIALNALLANPRVAGPLLDEIDRAEPPPEGAQAPDRVRLGSWVEYRDGDQCETRTVRIVETAHPENNLEFSVLSALGVALIGMAPGQSIIASDRLGSEWLVQVLRVTRPHERQSDAAASLTNRPRPPDGDPS
jgi:transcription elongation GreA/GreB family factor